MRQSRLNDANIALNAILRHEGIRFGAFGGYAISVLDGPRESKDVDVIVFCSKDRVIAALNGRSGFVYVNQARPDYAAFLWSESSNRANAVLVELFVTEFQGAHYSSHNIEVSQRNVTGDVFSSRPICILPPFNIFEGKLAAAATRHKFHDSADLRWLESRFRNSIRSRRNEINLEHVGLALKRWPELQHCFERIGIDTKAAKDRVSNVDIRHLPPPRPGDVQRSILG
ncbi:hypothetical protein A1O3_10057 [Capronia epimyces CBS 606.96]|uniref:Uncharacterized protein n=1 Tax=Capronia epimyces CBS 606.96 TaxID=1182542 RepID=W9XHU1_9EURO|nr:uncharacterized protein A1O3_10057 [Capronia epimyces CBS 606.96]EXJ76900.1 hypothetical protein A1O3_10057 [Capronia epimyces CBS 606.96]